MRRQRCTPPCSRLLSRGRCGWPSAGSPLLIRGRCDWLSTASRRELRCCPPEAQGASRRLVVPMNHFRQRRRPVSVSAGALPVGEIRFSCKPGTSLQNAGVTMPRNIPSCAPPRLVLNLQRMGMCQGLDGSYKCLSTLFLSLCYYPGPWNRDFSTHPLDLWPWTLYPSPCTVVPKSGLDHLVRLDRNLDPLPFTLFSLPPAPWLKLCARFWQGEFGNVQFGYRSLVPNLQYKVVNQFSTP